MLKYAMSLNKKGPVEEKEVLTNNEQNLGGKAFQSTSSDSAQDNQVTQKKSGNTGEDSPLTQKKREAFQVALDQIRKNYGKESVIFMDPNEKSEKVPSISTGSMNLDKALGIGGLPKGRITEIFGHEGSGKTTLALHVIANAQKSGGYCAFIDAEHALDMQLASKLGVKLQQMVLAQPDSGEKALEIADTLIRSGTMSVVVIDSVAALVPQAELEGEMGDVVMGGQARLMSQALRKMSSSISKTETVVIFINQIRSKIGMVFGNPETTSGGVALKFYASIRLEVKKRGIIKRSDVGIGQDVEVKVCKNKVSPPFQTASFELIWGEGINNLGEGVEWAVQANVIEKSGAWFSFRGEKIAQGKENLYSFLRANPEVHKDIMTALGKVQTSNKISS